MTGDRLSPPASDAERRWYARSLSYAFGGPIPIAARWMDMIPNEQVLLLRDDAGDPLAGLIEYRIGQFFGGQSVPMRGVAGVTVPPERRGSGVASRMMRAYVKGLPERGGVITALYASTFALYRSVGYEIAGLLYESSLELARFGQTDRSSRVLEMNDGVFERVKKAQRALASASNGNLDRNDHFWRRITDDPNVEDPPIRGYAVEGPQGPEGIEGWAFLRFEKAPSQPFPVVMPVRDINAVTPRAAARLLGLIASFAAQVSHAPCRLPPNHPLLLALSEHVRKADVLETWMLRIADLPAAISARGFPPDIDQEVHLAVKDELIETNHGAWTLRVSGGAGRISRGGRGDIAVEIGALSSLYTGFHSPEVLRSAGRLRGPDAAVVSLAAIFRGPMPWMSEFF